MPNVTLDVSRYSPLRYVSDDTKCSFMDKDSPSVIIASPDCKVRALFVSEIAQDINWVDFNVTSTGVELDSLLADNWTIQPTASSSLFADGTAFELLPRPGTALTVILDIKVNVKPILGEDVFITPCIGDDAKDGMNFVVSKGMVTSRVFPGKDGVCRRVMSVADTTKWVDLYFQRYRGIWLQVTAESSVSAVEVSGLGVFGDLRFEAVLGTRRPNVPSQVRTVDFEVKVDIADVMGLDVRIFPCLGHDLNYGVDFRLSNGVVAGHFSRSDDNGCRRVSSSVDTWQWVDLLFAANPLTKLYEVTIAGSSIPDLELHGDLPHRFGDDRELAVSLRKAVKSPPNALVVEVGPILGQRLSLARCAGKYLEYGVEFSVTNGVVTGLFVDSDGDACCRIVSFDDASKWVELYFQSNPVQNAYTVNVVGASVSNMKLFPRVFQLGQTGEEVVARV